jgi:hypothetical protein
VFFLISTGFVGQIYQQVAELEMPGAVYQPKYWRLDGPEGMTHASLLM